MNFYSFCKLDAKNIHYNNVGLQQNKHRPSYEPCSGAPSPRKHPKWFTTPYETHRRKVSANFVKKSIAGKMVLNRRGRRNGIESGVHLSCEEYLRLQSGGLATRFRYSLAIGDADLAEALGLTIVHVNGVFKELRGKQLITLRRCMLETSDGDELTQLSEFNT